MLDLKARNADFKENVPIDVINKVVELMITLVFIVIASIILGAWSWLQGWNYLAPYFIKGFVPRMISHIVLDTLNVQGIMWLWPITKKHFHILSIRTNSIWEGIVCVIKE